MEKKPNFRSYLRPKTQAEAITTAPAPKGWVDEHGKPLEIKIRKLSKKRLSEIRTEHTDYRFAIGDDGNVIVQGGAVVHDDIKDTDAIVCHVIAEALVQPDMHDYLADYDCVCIADLPALMFDEDALEHITNMVYAVQYPRLHPQKEKALIDGAKNGSAQQEA
ncbi:MAG: hypothetical protein LBN05_02015 [Oscillospiraceae bacterium]|nr:hypothetical protein [Oscillospiraceae bacterium]